LGKASIVSLAPAGSGILMNGTEYVAIRACEIDAAQRQVV